MVHDREDFQWQVDLPEPRAVTTRFTVAVGHCADAIAGSRAAIAAGYDGVLVPRLSIDRLRVSHRRREDYLGPWLPEPVVADSGPEEAAELVDSLTLGFLILLDRLKPAERAVFLLADVFAVPYADISATTGKSDAACRQIASRARRQLAIPAAAVGRPSPEQQRVVAELVVALVSGDIQAALVRLAPNAVLISDGGPPRRAARHPVVGGAWRASWPTWPSGTTSRSR